VVAASREVKLPFDSFGGLNPDYSRSEGNRWRSVRSPGQAEACPTCARAHPLPIRTSFRSRKITRVSAR